MISFTLRLPDELDAWLTKRAAANNRSKSAEVVSLLEQTARPKRYIYRHENQHLQKQLNDMAANGWRVVSIGPNYDGVFERVKDE